MVDFLGRDGNLALFSNGSDAAVVNTDLNLVVGVGNSAVLSAARKWETTDETFASSVLDLVAGATTSLDISIITASGRAYTIPDGVKAEAQKALDWHKEHHRGGTPVGLNTARTLAKGGQIGIAKIRHIAKYFPRHEVDKKGKGWKPGQDQFPSNGRIAWALWGGDAAWKWSKTIVERENKKAIAAGGYALPGYLDSAETYRTDEDYSSNLDAFKMAQELEPESQGPEFIARVRLDGSGIDRLYKVDSNGQVQVWDDCSWDDLGHVDGDIWTYDNALDDAYDQTDKDHFIVDPGSAIAISALLQQNPLGRVSIEDLDAEEANLFAGAVDDEDWNLSDYAMIAGASDGYTPEERSNIAKGAPRDATGKFAAKGGRTVIGNDASKGSGTITGVDGNTGNVNVKLDSGKTVTISAKFTTPEDKFIAKNAPKAPAAATEEAPLPTSGILGDTKTTSNQVPVKLPQGVKPLDSKELSNVLDNFGSYVQDQRGKAIVSGNNTSGGATVVKDGNLVPQVASK